MDLAVDPVSCPVGSVLEFLQDKFSAGVAATILRVYVVVIAAWKKLDDVLLGRDRLDSFLMHEQVGVAGFLSLLFEWGR